jgi:hypothetical protein
VPAAIQKLDDVGNLDECRKQSVVQSDGKRQIEAKHHHRWPDRNSLLFHWQDGRRWVTLFWLATTVRMS